MAWCLWPTRVGECDISITHDLPEKPALHCWIQTLYQDTQAQVPGYLCLDPVCSTEDLKPILNRDTVGFRQAA